ncbi:hypothetical protein [Paraburkholderia sp. BL6665CI2N2]|uniref:hypothetical protein n=1 Tax=Paraburkholderia sp. BL6665CI2N2 TaxID=1938806 RepID=UPI0014170F67|nr:hypothetical protein [Paraburkholderia sp. BL6665CI2N2]
MNLLIADGFAGDDWRGPKHEALLRFLAAKANARELALPNKTNIAGTFASTRRVSDEDEVLLMMLRI